MFSYAEFTRALGRSEALVTRMISNAISTPELFSWLRERRALGNPETKCLLIGFPEEQLKASLIECAMLAREVSRRRTVQIAIRELKHARFWDMDGNRKWTFHMPGQWCLPDFYNNHL